MNVKVDDFNCYKLLKFIIFIIKLYIDFLFWNYGFNYF